MPMKRPTNEEYPKKRARLEFTDASKIRSALRVDNLDGATEVLTSLRNQLNLKPQELSVPPQDERIALVKQWLEISPGANDLFAVWDNSTPRQASIATLVISTLSSVLALLSFHYTDHGLGQPVMKLLLNPGRLRQLNSYIGGSNNELIIVTMKLYNVMSKFAGGKDRKAVLEGFGWEIKSLPKLLNMRRKTHGSQDLTDPLVRPDIRTLYILLLLSFVDVDSPTQTKTTFLEQHRDAFLAIFKGTAQDHYSLAKKVLEVCWAGIWLDSKLKRTLKVVLFNETTIGHLIKLYDRVQPEDYIEDHIAADLIHHFLLAICTRPGVGICFKDRGWYPRESDLDDITPNNDEESKRRTGRIYNKILSNVLKTLKINEDSRQQELASKILSACPELVAGYWSSAALTLEPRLASKWITNISFFGTIIAHPVPALSLYLPNTQLYQPTPPPLATVIENILPSVNTKNNFSKGLQSSSGLAQHCTALALSKCLVKFKKVIEHFQAIATALEENVEDGQWSKRCHDLEREVRRRVPDFQVVVAFSQQKPASAPATSAAQPNKMKTALLGESAQRLLWLYHRCLPSVVAEARFEVGKLLQTFSTEGHAEVVEGDDKGTSQDAASKLYRIQELHVLKLLKDSEQFVWAGKIASLSHTPFYILLNAMTSVKIPVIRAAINSLLRHILSQSILFQEDRNEPDLWLKALPSKRVVFSGHGDHSLLQNEAENVITFLDDCVQRCLKTPYRYIEALHALVSSSTTSTTLDAGATRYSERLDMFPSPLLMSVIEQLEAKTNKNSLTPSQILGITSFIRKVVFYLTSKTSDLHFLTAYVGKVVAIVSLQRPPEQSLDFLAGIQREVSLLHDSLSFDLSNEPMTTITTSQAIQNYLAKAEAADFSKDIRSRTLAALEVVDWVRVLSSPLSAENGKRLITLVKSLDLLVLPTLVEQLLSTEVDLWSVLELDSALSEYRYLFKFDWLYFHIKRDGIVNETCQAALCNLVVTHTPTLVDLIRVVHIIMHKISALRKEPGTHESVLNGHLSLLSRILESSKLLLPTVDLGALKETVFMQANVLKDLLMSSLSLQVLPVVEDLLGVGLDPTSATDRKMVSDICSHWLNVLKSSIAEDTPASVSTACIWIKYLEPSPLFDVLNFLQAEGVEMSSVSLQEPINAVLRALVSISSAEWHAEASLAKTLPQLLSFRSVLPHSQLLEQVLSIAIEASLPMGLDGWPLFFLSSSDSTVDLTTIVKRSEARWTQRTYMREVEMDIRQFLTQETFSESTVKVISGFLYRHSSSCEVISQWAASEDCLRRDSRHILPIMHAFFNVSLSDGSATTMLDDDVWTPLLPQVISIISNEVASDNSRLQAQDCLIDILSVSQQNSSKILDVLAEEIQTVSKDAVTSQLLNLGTWLARGFEGKINSALSILVDRGMQRSIDNLSEEHKSSDFKTFLQALTSIINFSVPKTHFVETLLSVVVQHNLTNVNAVRLAIACLSRCQLKPAVVNRHLQSLIQHHHFFKICVSLSPESTEVRDTLIEMLHCLFNLHPNNTCQITHIEPLIRIYRGTLATSDLRILSIFQLFELQRKLSVTPLFSRWSAAQNTTSTSALEAIHSLEPILVLRTSIHFPQWRHPEEPISKTDAQSSSLYDPVFLMLLFSQMIAEQPPSSAFAWIEMFRTNVVSLFIRALSAKDGRMRELALCQIIAVWRKMETADMQEKLHLQYILNLLKDLMPVPTLSSSPSDPQYPRRLPTYTTLLLMHALRGIFYPSNFIYPLTARFLLQRPSLDTTDVPMLYGMLYSSSDDNWKKDRAWIIKFLADGMVGSEDWKVLKRRHTWDLLASLFQSSDVSDSALRLGILEVLANLTCNAQATTSLVLKSGLLVWIEMQLLSSVPNSTTSSSANAEGVEWIKILENVLVIVDGNKIEASTNGEWRAVIGRCLEHLLDEQRCTSALTNFLHAVPVILRLASLSSKAASTSAAGLADMSTLMQLSLACLEKLETHIQIKTNVPIQGGNTHSEQDFLIPTPPHRSQNLHQRLDVIPSSTPALSSSTTADMGTNIDTRLLRLWGTLLEMLWHSSMLLDQRSSSSAWDALMPRLLLWRSMRTSRLDIQTPNHLDVAEWARKEVIINLQQDLTN